MLILTRRSQETICIGDDVRVKIMEINGSQVKLGIIAPKSTAVHREEIYDKIKAETTPDIPKVVIA